ncbi:hypothetical protein DFH07DRAFT_772808 [Mycena maculata]|uniref:Uncharacterized protein n=1 Tax=Mycena maculata TaxID=230809 RepID=A0AAD7NF70_9AGAR|nr:hypothetical protein DFH07DRAFT_772808 [Mycena maculata]
MGILGVEVNLPGTKTCRLSIIMVSITYGMMVSLLLIEASIKTPQTSTIPLQLLPDLPSAVVMLKFWPPPQEILDGFALATRVTVFIITSLGSSPMSQILPNTPIVRYTRSTQGDAGELCRLYQGCTQGASGTCHNGIHQALAAASVRHHLLQPLLRLDQFR